ncbi:MAG TPA: gluconate 2-dehydrogenase subunit 3 family protein [Streptosporangiaceae bacterium]|nr:gluconate 2-dehydrogenase subunit 3 family protein [Streptosporangiaceae bacterium]
MNVPRRAIVTALPVVAAALAGLPPEAAVAAAPRRFFTVHEAAVVTEATARIAPGPADDPAETGHPGAREANVTGYIDALLGSAPVIFAGGPWSDRHGGARDLMAAPAEPDPVAKIAWQRRLENWRGQYRAGVARLDKLTGGDFATASKARQDHALTQAGGFLALLFEHTIEGLYSVPEYGGNRGLAGWRDISYPGDSQPAGYSPAQVTDSDGPDPVQQTKVITDVLKFLSQISQAVL